MSETEERPATGTASRLFDLRMIIAVLFGIYGVVLTVMGATTTTQRDLDRAGGLNLNLWSGIGMLVLAGLFGVWVWLRPLQLPTAAEIEESPASAAPTET